MRRRWQLQTAGFLRSLFWMAPASGTGAPESGELAKKTEKNLSRQSYESLASRLEEIVGRLEGGGLTLEESLEAFEEGVALARESEARLSEAEKRVDLLLAVRDGKPVVRPSEGGAAAGTSAEASEDAAEDGVGDGEASEDDA